MIKITDHHVHVWTTAYHKVSDRQLLKRYYSLLNKDEVTRYHGFHFEKDKLQYLIARAMLKAVLSMYHTQIAETDWVFEYSEKGKPSIAKSLVSRPVQFNLSHTDGMIALAISQSCQVGIDVENQNRVIDYKTISARYFSANENQAMLDLPLEQQQQRFYELWTLKESYIKARALSLAFVFSQFDFGLSDNKRIDFNVDKASDHSGKHWKFWQYKLDNEFIIAVTFELAKVDQATQICFKKIVPLSEHQSMELTDSRQS